MTVNLAAALSSEKSHSAISYDVIHARDLGVARRHDIINTEANVVDRIFVQFNFQASANFYAGNLRTVMAQEPQGFLGKSPVICLDLVFRSLAILNDENVFADLTLNLCLEDHLISLVKSQHNNWTVRDEN